MRAKSKRCWWIVTAVVFIAATASTGWAAEVDNIYHERENSLKPGSWSIQFQISDEFGLDPFNGMAISLKRHFSEKTALRIGMDLNIESENLEDERLRTYDDTLTYTDARTEENDHQSIEINSLFIYYPSPEKSINLFLGAGPLFRLSRKTGETDIIETPGFERTRISSWSRTIALGVLGVGGVEWFARERISFHAEYRASLKYRMIDYDRTDTYYDSGVKRKNEGERNEWNFGGVIVTLGVSLYF